MSTNFKLGSGTASCTGTGATSTATLNNRFGKLTTAALTTAAAGTHTITLTDAQVNAGDIVFASVAYGTATAGAVVVERITPADGSVVIVLKNIHASDAVNGTLVVSFMAFGA